MPNNDDQLQQQYQEILNKYASSLTPPPEPPVPEPALETIPKPEVKPEPMIETPVEPILPPTPALDPEPMPELPVEPISVSKPESVVDQPPENIVPPIYFSSKPENQNPSNFFKYLFYLSFIAFVAVAVAIIYNIINSQPDIIPVITATPTTVPASVCELGDKKYTVGQSFPSSDSCNTCSCNPDLTIACTQKACVTPEPTVKIVGKIYKDIKYGYQFECPTTAKYVVEATSVNGNKIPFKQESCTSGDSVATISVYDNTVVHDFADFQTKISPNKKYIVTFEGDTSNVFSSFEFL